MFVLVWCYNYSKFWILDYLGNTIKEKVMDLKSYIKYYIKYKR